MSDVGGQMSEGGELGMIWMIWTDGGQMSEVRGRMSEVGCQKSEVSGQMLG